MLAAGHGRAEEAKNAADLAKKLQNPVASLISVPMQSNFDFNVGPDEDGFRYGLNAQPVIPLSLADDWNLISRTIVPIVHQDDVVPGTGTQSGLGDIVQSFFLSPAQPGPLGVIWGAGPVVLLPTATHESLGGEKWGLGPTAVALRQRGPWTYGALVNHLWSFAGTARREDVNASFLQPFVSYTLKTATTFSLNNESTYDWNGEQWSVPINAAVSQVLKLGSQLFSVSAGPRYWAESPRGGPHDVGFRVTLTLLFPT